MKSWKTPSLKIIKKLLPSINFDKRKPKKFNYNGSKRTEDKIISNSH
jgi:hypothetical protein